jgi:ankyrin repeat protein
MLDARGLGGVDLQILDGRGFSPVDAAAYRHRASILRTILDAGGDRDARRADGLAPIHRALLGCTPAGGFSGAERGTGVEATLQVLLEAGADASRRDAAGRTPLEIWRRTRCADRALAARVEAILLEVRKREA